MKWERGNRAIRDAIRDLDKTQNKALWHQIENIWVNAEEHFHPAQKSADDHEQGSYHCRRVEENLSALIPEGWKGTKVSVMELFILSAAAALHDSGKKGDLMGDHGMVAARAIWAQPERFGLDPMQGYAVGWLIFAHANHQINRVPPTYSIRLETIQLRLLAALFCLADTLHCDYTRVLRQITEEAEEDGKKNPVTLFRLRVSGVDIDNEGYMRITALPKNVSELQVIDKGFQWILDNEMTPIMSILREARYPHRLSLHKDPTYLRLEAEPRVAEEVCEIRAFPGLDFYREGDVFKGREKEVQTLYETVLVSSVSLLIGNSGIGKTSLVCAGLFPKLRSIGWNVVRCCPSLKQPNSLIRDMSLNLLPDEPLPLSIVTAFERVSERYKEAEVVVFFDQFEDVLSATPQMMEDLNRAILGVIAGRFTNLHLLFAYRTEVEAEMGQFFQELTGSKQGPPRCNLIALKRKGAEEALRAGFNTLKIGLETKRLPNESSLMDLILNDIEAQGRGFYPPYVQIVGELLAEAAQATEDKIITLKIYKDLGGVSIIIGRYLFKQLEKFAGDRKLAEDVLKTLVGSGGIRKQKTLDELQQDTQIVDTSTLTELLNKMSARRMIRPLEGNQYEIIHDFLAHLVDRELIGQEERELKYLQELLFSKSRSYANTKELLTPTDLAHLYLLRDRIIPDKLEKTLLLHSCLAGAGPGWYWLRNLTPDESYPLASEALSHPSELLRKNATELLAILKGKEILPQLKQMLKDQRSSVREVAVWAIANLRAHEALPELKEKLKDESWAVREAALRALGKLQAQGILDEVRQLLCDKYWQVRWAAVETIGQLGGDEALIEMKQMLKDSNWAIKAAAVGIAVEMEGQQSLPWLKDMLRDPDWAVRKAVVKALLKLREKNSLQEVVQMLNDKDWEVRETAVEALAVIEGGNALPKFRKMLKNRDPYKRRAAVKLIAQLAGEKAPPLIIKLLYDRHWIVRAAVVKALTKTGGQKALEKLWGKLRSENEEVRKAIVQGIVELGSDDDVMELAQIVSSSAIEEWGRSANDALKRLDRKLYFPFAQALQLFFGE